MVSHEVRYDEFKRNHDRARGIYGTAQTKKIFLRYGAREPLFGVKVGDLKIIVNKVKTNHPLALELYDTGNSDAMYLAGLLADPIIVTEEELQRWVEKAYWYMISEYTVAVLAADSKPSERTWSRN